MRKIIESTFVTLDGVIGDPHTTWNATVLDGDTAQAVRALKGAPGQDILKHGTGELDRTLLSTSCSTSCTCGCSRWSPGAASGSWTGSWTPPT